MTPFERALRYRRLAARETNKSTISLLHRLADDVERRARARAEAPRGPAEVVSLAARLTARSMLRGSAEAA
ncbi:hypothetical protein X566_01830 [Afipia sp. P52-10]|jgi:hypothetical protein|uniref:hypothetical protein n=1 Tax=Afipia sp. P52-10 TaxID=1429916 RepID=UPI0003DF1BB3|nr:hypothetical protein [Afipia sp. P52-10]ETR78899.1 hypothetical protein X566_01830 [Afipia sp. P52-10]